MVAVDSTFGHINCLTAAFAAASIDSVLMDRDVPLRNRELAVPGPGKLSKDANSSRTVANIAATTT
jgi:anaerobic glycerol-3-phosphate dehydrogenase